MGWGSRPRTTSSAPVRAPIRSWLTAAARPGGGSTGRAGSQSSSASSSASSMGANPAEPAMVCTYRSVSATMPMARIQPTSKETAFWPREVRWWASASW